MRLPLPLLALLASGCFIPAFPPPSSYAPMPPATALQQPSTQVHGSFGILPTVGGAWYAPMESQPGLVMDIQGQLGLTHLLTNPGLWLRTRPEEHAGPHWGMRMGGVVGSGDIIGFMPFTMPEAGVTTHLQYAHGSPNNAGSFAVTLGGEYLFPVFPDAFVREETDDDGDTYYVIPVPGWYLSVDLRYDFPLGEEHLLFIGGGLDLAYTSTPLPSLSMGLRL